MKNRAEIGFHRQKIESLSGASGDSDGRIVCICSVIRLECREKRSVIMEAEKQGAAV